MFIGYVRASTNDQDTDLQRNALNCAGYELIFLRVNHQHETNNLASNSGLFGCTLSAQNCAPISPEKNAKLQEWEVVCLKIL